MTAESGALLAPSAPSPAAVAPPASPPPLDAAAVAALNAELAARSPREILLWLKQAALGRVVQFTSFGLSGMVITDLLSKMGWDIPIAFIDTLYHFDETLDLRRRAEERYGRKLLAFGPQAAATRAEFEAMYGKELWKSDPDFYQFLTKVEPTARALKELSVDVWITGRRRTQGDARSDLEVLELDDDGRIKVNPLAYVSWSDVEQYIKDNKVPYNALLDRGYKSVGDFHSTIATAAEGSERAGRWAGTARTECGMHKGGKKHLARRSTAPPEAVMNSNRSVGLFTIDSASNSGANSSEEDDGEADGVVVGGVAAHKRESF